MPCVVLLSAGNSRHPPQRRTGTGTQRLCDVRRTDEMIARTVMGLFVIPVYGFTAACFTDQTAGSRNGLHHGGLLYYHEERAEEAGRCDYGGVGAEEILWKDSGAASESRILLKDQAVSEECLPPWLVIRLDMSVFQFYRYAFLSFDRS